VTSPERRWKTLSSFVAGGTLVSQAQPKPRRNPVARLISEILSGAGQMPKGMPVFRMKTGLSFGTVSALIGFGRPSTLKVALFNIATAPSTWAGGDRQTI
jgi:hypothetical protein